jgi:murein L,D-transpeptidase YcbB/YkuD
MLQALFLIGFATCLCVSAVAAQGAGQASPFHALPDLQAKLFSGAAGGERLLSRERLRLFYGPRGNRPAWSDGGRPSLQVDALVAALRTADREGLRPAEYHTVAIETLLRRLRAERDPAAAAGAAADLDLLLSDAFFLYASHLTEGRVSPQAVEPEWNIPGRGRNLVFLLGAALEHGHLAETLGLLAPPRGEYRRLREALVTLRTIAAAGGWPHVPEGAALREGDRGPRVAALRRRLAATGELPAGGDTTGEVFDAPLAVALGRFQERHGIEPDAVAGKRTLSELNTPAHRRAEQIVANLERLRWLPGAMGPRHLLVNIAGYQLVLTEGGLRVAAMRVIVGRQARRTPFFTGEIRSIRLNPTWTVPERLAVEDKLPLILEDRDFLREHGFRVFALSGEDRREIDPAEVDWTRLSKGHFPYLLRQDPGPENALGRIKFQIPNVHDIYLHDTPSRGLFARAERGFSSGCIRVEHALELAVRLLAGDPSWPRARIVEAIASGDTVDIVLSEPLPVYLISWTAWVDEGGALQFRDDIYGRDAAITEALARPLEPD